MSRYVVVFLLQPVAVGDSFITREWPLHVTVLPVFASPATPAELGDRLAAARPQIDGNRIAGGAARCHSLSLIPSHAGGIASAAPAAQPTTENSP